MYVYYIINIYTYIYMIYIIIDLIECNIKSYLDLIILGG